MKTILKPYVNFTRYLAIGNKTAFYSLFFKGSAYVQKNYKVCVPIAQFCASRYYQRTGYLAICNNLTDITDPCQAHKSPNCPTINVLAFAKTPMPYFSIFSPQSHFMFRPQFSTVNKVCTIKFLCSKTGQYTHNGGQNCYKVAIKS